MSPTIAAYVSRPQVLIDGQPRASLDLDVQTVLVEETTEGLFRCEISFNNVAPPASNRRYIYFQRDLLEFGKEVTVRLGAGDPPRQVFKGRISGIEALYPAHGGGQILVLAEDRLQDLRMTRRTRTFEDVSDADVIRRIAADHSLTPQLNLNGPTHKVLAQVNQSDLAFIRERARRINAELYVDGATLYAQTRADRGGTPVNLAYGVNLVAFSVRADLAGQCSEVGVSGWDVATKSAIEETAGASAISAELGGDTSGGAILAEAFGERNDRIVHTVPLTSAEARGIAEARYRERARRFVTGAGMADGDARIRVGAIVDLSQLGPLFDGEYYVVRVRHSYDGQYGFRTEFDVERPGLGQV